jgi:hypothetical protein
MPIHVSAFVSECHNGKQILQKWKEKQKKERKKEDNFIHNPKDTTSIQKNFEISLKSKKIFIVTTCCCIVLYCIILLTEHVERYDIWAK